MPQKLSLEYLREFARKAKSEIKKSKTAQTLEQTRVKFLGRKGELAKIFDVIKGLSVEERKVLGKAANEIKTELVSLFLEQQRLLALFKEKIREKFDITRPGVSIARGHLHPLTQTRDEIEAIFSALGFSTVEYQEVEDEWHNFDALNIPPEHPARDMWDTLWLKPQAQNNAEQYAEQRRRIPLLSASSPRKFAERTSGEDEALDSPDQRESAKLLLRTHTSPGQIRFMQSHQPPLRIISFGRVFRHEATDASHEIQFYQVEGLMVGKKVSVADFRGIMNVFLKRFFKSDITWRMRPSFYPFVEPGFDIDMRCTICNGKGCAACGGDGWLEMMGAGMVHPNVFTNSGYAPAEWQGFAFGFGLDRFMMMRKKVDDIRLSYSGDLRFLRQF